jgi:hypothetical protein
MAVQFEWHSTLPILVATYTGTLSADDYDTLREERAAMLDDGPAHIILVANAQQFDGLIDVDKIEQHAHLLLDQRIYRLLVVFQKELYQRLSHQIGDTREYNFPVHFFDDPGDALAYAEQLARHIPG